MTKTGSHWRDICRPIIAATIKEYQGKDTKALRKALYEAYPFGERKMYPYKVWLSEIQFQLGKSKRLWHLGKQKNNVVDERQEVMF